MCINIAMNHCDVSDMVRRVRMLCPAWLLALAVLCAGGSEVRAQCWENARCRDLTTDENILVSYNRPYTHDCLAAKFFQLNLQVSSLIQIKINILLINRETNITITTANCRIRDLNKPQPWMRTQFMWLAEKRCAELNDQTNDWCLPKKR